MTTKINSEDLPDIRNRVYELHIKLGSFGYCSEEFWAIHDELVKLLDYGIRIALHENDEKTANEFKEMWDRLKERVPSGYWK